MTVKSEILLKIKNDSLLQHFFQYEGVTFFLKKDFALITLVKINITLQNPNFVKPIIL